MKIPYILSVAIVVVGIGYLSSYGSKKYYDNLYYQSSILDERFYSNLSMAFPFYIYGEFGEIDDENNPYIQKFGAFVFFQGGLSALWGKG
jgi:hypothetical protein